MFLEGSLRKRGVEVGQTGEAPRGTCLSRPEDMAPELRRRSGCRGARSGRGHGSPEPGRKCSDYCLPSGWQEAGSEGPDKEDGAELLNIGGEKRSKERGRSSKTRKGDWAAVRAPHSLQNYYITSPDQSFTSFPNW